MGPARPVSIPALGLTVLVLLLSPLVLAASNPYAPNVTASKGTTSCAASGAVHENDTAKTGVYVSLTGLGSSACVIVTTESLNSPSEGVSAFSASGTTLYFDVYVQAKGGPPVPSGAMSEVCLANQLITSAYDMHYWNGSAWVRPLTETHGANSVCGGIPAAALEGTNLVASSSGMPLWMWALALLLIAAGAAALGLYLHGRGYRVALGAGDDAVEIANVV